MKKSYRVLKIFVLIFCVVTTFIPLAACQKSDTSSEVQVKEALDYKPFADEIFNRLSTEFEYISIMPPTGSEIRFVIYVANTGMSTSAISLKKNDDIGNEQYAEFVESMKALTLEFKNTFTDKGLSDVHIELVLLDDVDIVNQKNGYDNGVRSILEICDGDVFYNILEDKAPESYEFHIQITMGMENALETAYSYLNYSSFSYTGLIKQLEFEKYTHSEAVYAADNCGADWNEQAAITAAKYLELSSFSREGLIHQLEFEGFTHDQAVYGVSANGY